MQIAAGAGEGLDPNFRPSMSQQFDFTVQRQINSKVHRRIRLHGQENHPRIPAHQH